MHFIISQLTRKELFKNLKAFSNIKFVCAKLSDSFYLLSRHRFDSCIGNNFGGDCSISIDIKALACQEIWLIGESIRSNLDRPDRWGHVARQPPAIRKNLTIFKKLQ